MKMSAAEMVVKRLLLLWVVLLNCGGVRSWIPSYPAEFYTEFTPNNNCSREYMDILRSNFSCKIGSIHYCSSGFSREDINQVGHEEPKT